MNGVGDTPVPFVGVTRGPEPVVCPSEQYSRVRTQIICTAQMDARIADLSQYWWRHGGCASDKQPTFPCRSCWCCRPLAAS